ncbi:MAG: aspartate aminotransferase family protein, partial [Acidimicrobiia bacterium]|nr:aspartate aminotransferase family protein [Acidimicrobiia bacterium]
NDLAAAGEFLVIAEADGIWLTDDRGRRYIDAMSGLWVVNAGHGRRELAEVAAAQMSELAYANPFAYATRPAVDLASRLARLTPASIERFYLVNTGSDAVDTSLRMAKQYHWNRGERRRFKVISRNGSYHGMTAGALSVNRSPMVNKAPFEPLMPGSVGIPTVSCSRCPYEKTFPECDVFCARALEQTILAEGAQTVAAFIAEPISTAAGCHLPPAGYWRTIREVCDRHGVLVIADEVINGFGRTGRWFGIEHFGIEPDLMTMAKGLTSGYQPLAAVGVSGRVAEAFVGEDADTFVGGITFGAHPVACAVALANLDIIERERLVDNAASTGAYLGERLVEMVAGRRVAAATRGIGLMHAVDVTRDSRTGEGFRPEDQAPKRLTASLRDHGLLCRAGASISIAPPLVATRADCDELVDRLDRALAAFESDLAR